VRLLAVTAEPPWPPVSGYRIRCWELLGRLADRFEVRLLCLAEDGRRSSGWEGRFASVRLVPRRHASATSLARSLVSSVPHHAALHDSPELRRALVEESRDCDAIVAHYLYFARALESLGGRRPALVLDQHNMDRDTWESHAEAAHGPSRWWLRRQAALIRRDEARHLPLFDAIFAVSEPDAARTRALAPSARVEVAPNGADCDAMRPGRGSESGRVLLFSGTSARRNVDGLAWFLRDCWPLVRANVPGATLVIAGRIGPGDLPHAVRRAPGLTFTGQRADLQFAFQGADAAIVPVRLGGGTKLKVFEALASGLPVVAVSASATGCCCGPEDGVLAEGDAPAYAAAASSLLLDDSLRKRLGAAGRRHAEQAHDWGHIAARVGDVIAEVAEARAGRPVQGTEPVLRA
jgi:glycosyltransferase involved in cell wall biosynthesis